MLCSACWILDACAELERMSVATQFNFSTLALDVFRCCHAPHVPTCFATRADGAGAREDAKLVGAFELGLWFWWGLSREVQGLLSWAWYERRKAEEAGIYIGCALVTIAMTITIWVLLTLFEHRNDVPRVNGTVAYYLLSTEHEKSVKYFPRAMEQSSTDLALARGHSWGSSTQGAVATVNYLTVFEEAESWEDQVHMFEAVLLDSARPHFRFRPTFQIQRSDLVLQARAGDGRAAPNDGVPAPGSVGRGACTVDGVLCQAVEFQVQQPAGDLLCVRLGRRGWGQPGIAEASEHPTFLSQHPHGNASCHSANEFLYCVWLKPVYYSHPSYQSPVLPILAMISPHFSTFVIRTAIKKKAPLDLPSELLPRSSHRTMA
ncbi:hypothetical protein DFH09DRAFT_1068993 [Mycena vulgaris]|nr:hypothetical protein DFH09DRAFT_1068993 [Mycena vulgaris]